MAAAASEVEIYGKCYSACTLITAQIPKERLCFGSEASLQFHKASTSRNDPTPHLQATQWMIARYPQDIQNWIAAKGGITKMPNGNNFWTLDANELWAMGYRKCGGVVPAQYRGLWCEARDGTYYRCREATSESSRLIRRDGFNITEEGDCRVNAVTPIAKGHRLRMRCTGTSDEPELVDVNLRLDARGRLHLDQEFVPVPVAPVPSLDSQSIAVWKAAIVTKIDEKKHYPEAAVANREHGVARVFFAIDREGRLLESRIVQSSGSANLDAAALDTLKRVEPFPPPDSLKGERIDLTIPFRSASTRRGPPIDPPWR